MNSKHWRMLVNTFWTSRVAIAARIAEERRCPESWNELTAPEDYDLPLDKVEYQIRPAKWPWQVYIIWLRADLTFPISLADLQARGSGPSRVSWLALDRAPPRRSPPRIRRAAAFVAHCGSSGVTVVQRSGYMRGTIGIRCLNGELNQLEHSVPKQDRPRYRQADSDSNHHRWPKRTSVCL